MKEFLIKGFVLDDQRLKRLGGGVILKNFFLVYEIFVHLKRYFFVKFLIFTSIDYDPSAETSKTFFKTVQNKMHWAVHGNTAAEIIYKRVDAKKRNMGLTSWLGKNINQSEVEIAKNYLSSDELNILNRLVSIYLDFAELQALNHEPMYMKDWIIRLDDFLKMTNKKILLHAGKISHDKVLEKAREEYF